LTESQPQFRLNNINEDGTYRDDLCLAFHADSGFDDVQYDGHAQARLELVSHCRQDQGVIVSLEPGISSGLSIPRTALFS
jgi:hypothetical protein